ncbi:putative pancreatic lipase-related protein 2 isoform X2 [Apostichopus japonicus]|uniref:Putative pancreatic lipase-related protein 2 isoform X2 n=1 Tax=Stichopus japonicus TaxID=307972 RepID=A0A2G8KU63_STIJA|nr:putative pancreatic lipase-related protein 2 isoform X2 [Apostichopus japonicus]
MHFMGHSLGAHTAGYAGAEQGKYGRITGLDSAGPGFRDVLDSCKLDPSDAIFVDCIHTDGDILLGGGFGIYEPIGHVDIYPNGGKDMPGCLVNPVCDHSRVLYYLLRVSLPRHRAHSSPIPAIVGITSAKDGAPVPVTPVNALKWDSTPTRVLLADCFI